MSTEAQERLDKWNEKRQKVIDKNKVVRRLSGEAELGNWATIVRAEDVSKDVASEEVVKSMEQATRSRRKGRERTDLDS
jgi:hypothetical protein